MRVLAIAGLVLSLMGCGGSGGVSALVGNWRAIIIGEDGVGQVNCPGSFMQGNGEIASCGPDDRVTLSENGTFSTYDLESDSELSGRWSASGSTITLTDLAIDGQPVSGSLTIDFVLSGDRITIRDREDPE